MASAVSSQVEKSLCALGSKGSLYTGVSLLLYGLCVYMDICVHLSIAVFLNKWNWVGISVHHDGRSPCCSQRTSRLSQVLGHTFLKCPCHYC